SALDRRGRLSAFLPILRLAEPASIGDGSHSPHHRSRFGPRVSLRMGPKVIPGPLLPPSLRDTIVRQDDRLPARTLLQASVRETAGLPYRVLAVSVAAAVALVLAIILLLLRHFFRI